jgi:ankyrin repeat protein
MSKKDLFDAVRNNDVEKLTKILSKKVNVNSLDDDESALMLASAKGFYECTQLLLSHGASVDLKSSRGTTALRLASRCGQPECVKLLLEHGADVNIRSGEAKYFALMDAVQETGENNIQCARILLENGALIDLAKRDGTTPLMSAADHGDIGMTKLLLEKGAATETKGIFGWTALVMSAQSGNIECTRLLLDAGAAIDGQDSKGQTALYSTIISIYDHDAHDKKKQEFIECAKLLIDRGASFDIPDNKGISALEYAKENGIEEIVSMMNTKNSH